MSEAFGILIKALNGTLEQFSIVANHFGILEILISLVMLSLIGSIIGRVIQKIRVGESDSANKKKELARIGSRFMGV